jgi:hypothetical protein
MTDSLTQYRNYCRMMEQREHSEDCLKRIGMWNVAKQKYVLGQEFQSPVHRPPDPGPKPECLGSCISPREREEWKRQADEIDQYRGVTTT